ncbi:helix-turn-helix domain-containing protein [Candidatus Woesearchaeota archaeon]|nr:helix-turn-helix domain-containing protein [Candidatus Woesearchaeota archaeon]
MKEKLIFAGLSRREAEIYETLLKKRQATANEVAKASSIERTVAYNTLNKLIEKGFVSYINKEKKRYYFTTSAENLLVGWREKQSIIEALVKDIKTMVPGSEIKPMIQIYEGKEGLKVLYEIALQYKNATFYSMGVTGKSLDILGLSFRNIAARAGKNKVKLKIIANPEARGHRFTKEKIVETRYAQRKYKSAVTTSIFGEYVVLNLTEKPVMVLIHSKEMATAYRNYFSVLWDYATKK